LQGGLRLLATEEYARLASATVLGTQGLPEGGSFSNMRAAFFRLLAAQPAPSGAQLQVLALRRLACRCCNEQFAAPG